MTVYLDNVRYIQDSSNNFNPKIIVAINPKTVTIFVAVFFKEKALLKRK